MAKTDYQTIDAYHQAFNGEALARMQAIRRIINELVPDAEETISYQIPCFKYYGYLLYYCAFPRHISLSNPYSDAFWDHFKTDLEGYKTSKSAIQIPMDKPLPEKLVRKIVAFRKKESEKKARSKSWLSLLSAPARRALESNGITTLEQLSMHREEDLMQFHGFGKSSLPKLRTALTAKGLTFKQS